MQAKPINEIAFDVIQETTCYWGSPAIVIRYSEYEELPKSLEYKGNRFARLGYNSDNSTAFYTVRTYQLRAKGV